jgi:predicted esterase/DNA-binding SARP family transcriptional activator
MRKLTGHFVLGASILLFALGSCENPNAAKVKALPAEIIEESCTLNPEHSYHIYLPTRNEEDMFPLMVVLDPHGEGKKVLDKFAQLPEPGFIFAASNTIQNNFPGYEQAISDLIEDVKSKYPTKNQPVFLAGFSGGARMALSYASRHETSGLIACGAFVRDQQLQQINGLVYGLVGTGDFNFMEYANTLLFPNQKEFGKVALNIFDGGHEWPDKITLQQAVDFMGCLRADVNKEKKRSYFQQNMALADSLFASNTAMASSFILRNLQVLFPTGKTNEKLKKKLNEIYSSHGYKKEKSKWLTELQQENELRNHYLNALSVKPLVWWKHEKEVMEKQLADPTNSKKALLRRLQSFWGIVLYSQVKSSLQKNDLEQAANLLDVYTLLEPENPDAWYYTALHAFKNDQEKQALEFLQKADSLGFSDMKRLKSDFPQRYWN